MKKPIHRFAFVLWVVAIAVVLGDAFYLYRPEAPLAVTMTPQMQSMLDNFTQISAWAQFRSTMLTCSALAAIGVFIEILDQMRWDAAQKNGQETANK